MTAAAASAGPRPWQQGALWLAFLGPFFFASYGLSNWLAGVRPGVGSVVFEWESAIPFLAWTIVPYWLIDLAYAVSLLICRTHVELAAHARRLLAAQLVAVTCFIAFPLRFSFDRPTLDGPFGWLFATLASFDLPYNQAPSLHLALLVILWQFYRQRLPRAWHPLLHAASLLIALSALTTWQHHFIDIPTGLWLGACCVLLFPGDGRAPFRCAWPADPSRRALSMRYALGAIALAALGCAIGGAALWLLWAAGSAAWVACAYACGTGYVYGKRADGTLGPIAAALHAPYLAGAWVNARLWTRTLPRAQEVAPGVWLGRVPTLGETPALELAAIVDVCAELPSAHHGREYTLVPMLDLLVPDSATIERAAAAIERARAQGPVLVCCALGFSRSAVAVCAWLLRTGAAANVAAAIGRVRTARPGVVLSERHREALARWQQAYASSVATHRGGCAARKHGTTASLGLT